MAPAAEAVQVKQEFDEAAFDDLQARIEAAEVDSPEYKRLSREALKMLSWNASID